MTLEMRSLCERCGDPLAAAGVAYICVFECSYCERCAAALGHICKNCGGELVLRPRAAAG